MEYVYIKEQVVAVVLSLYDERKEEETGTGTLCVRVLSLHAVTTPFSARCCGLRLQSPFFFPLFSRLITF